MHGRTLRLPVRALVVLALVAQSVAAQRAPAPRDTVTQRDSVNAKRLTSVRVEGRIDDLVGVASSASQGRVGAADLRARPIAREGELLETIPGLIATQHSGDGKANQYFVRGFNLDHGTDFSTRVEGMPVNLPTHGHGQGYTDLNFLMPELVDHLEYKLGVQHAEIGDFGSAGGAEFRLVRSLARPFASVESGEYGLGRLAVGASSKLGAGDILAAGEAKRYDGPWTLSQRLRKYNGVARYAWGEGKSRFDILAMAYRNEWRATDQIPVRAVDAGLLDRFAQVDPTNGGNSERYSLSANWQRVGANVVQDATVYAIRSNLSLFSNFTYFLDDPVRGDQFHQVDRRTVLGANLRQARSTRLLGAMHTVTTGVQGRADLIGDVALHRTTARVRHSTVRADNVTQGSLGLFAEGESRWRPWLRSVVGVRADGYSWRVASDLAANSGRRTAAIVSPKGTLIATLSSAAELYLGGGYGFHSNDARGTTIRVDPATGAPAERVDPLVRSRGLEVGARLSPMEGFRSTVTLWSLQLASELLFIGDAGATEATDASRRRGVTFANFWRPIPQLSVDADLSLAKARLSGVPRDLAYIPGALERVVAGGITWQAPTRGPFAALRVRHFGAYPLIEDNGARAHPSTLVNADAGWRLSSGVQVRVMLLNLGNARASDIQYFYASRLPGEPGDGVEGVHAHPAEPRQLRVSVGWNR